MSTTPGFEKKIKERVTYIAKELKNPIAAKAVWEDYKDTRRSLAQNAGIIQEPDNAVLKELKLRRINFRSHNYFLLYRIEDGRAIITDVFHFLEDYERKLK